jgi:hypothetical protein
MVSFQTKNQNLGKFWSALDWKMLLNLMAVCNMSLTLDIFYDDMIHFFPVFGIMYQEKSGNTVSDGFSSTENGLGFLQCKIKALTTTLTSMELMIEHNASEILTI